MNSIQIDRALTRRCRGKFLGVFAKDTLPIHLPLERSVLLVCNLDKKSKPGTHWIAMYISNDGVGEYFDSYGRPPENTFRRYLNKKCKIWSYNEMQLQSASSYFCGQYCIFYCLYKSIGYDIKSITSLFSGDTGLNDSIVHAFVCNMLSK